MNKKKVAIITSVVVLLLLVAGISYAYYSATVKENNKTETVIKTNELEIVYTGTQEINVSDMVPGDSFTKKFTIENTSNIPVTYNIYLEGITNEFNEDLVYILKDKDGIVIEEEVLPSTNTGKTYLITDIEIDSNELKEYEMTIEFKYSDKDQNKLQGKNFIATLGIDTTPVKIVKVVNDKLELDKLNSGDTVTKTFSVKNLSKETQSYDVILSDVISTYGDNLTYSLTKNGTELISNETMPTSDTTILSSQTISANTTDEYVMTINFNNTTAALEYMIAAENDKFSSSITITSKDTTVTEERNIVKAYTYNQTSGAENYCVTGNEATCLETKCYESNDANSCASGTIIDYKVNDTETVRFHVMYDNGATLTMQSQRNTVYNVAWYGIEQDYTNINGPMTILPKLEEETSDWKNVNEQTYTMGSTVFKTNGYTGCSADNLCNTNSYILTERNSNARMITLQEAKDLGCSANNQTCPIWMYNYLSKSTEFGGTQNDNTIENNAIGNYAYWTMSANPSGNNIAWFIYEDCHLGYYYTYVNYVGARAVVEINK